MDLATRYELTGSVMCDCFIAGELNLTGNSGQILAPLYKKSPGSIEFVYELNGLAGGVVSLSVNAIDMINSSLLILDGDNTSVLVEKKGLLVLVSR